MSAIKFWVIVLIDLKVITLSACFKIAFTTAYKSWKTKNVEKSAIDEDMPFSRGGFKTRKMVIFTGASVLQEDF